MAPEQAQPKTQDASPPESGPGRPAGVLSLFNPRRLSCNGVIALQQLARRPLRTLLLLQGVIWGTALAIFAPGSIGGSRENAWEHWQSYHLDRIVVTPDVASASTRMFAEQDLAEVARALGPERLKHLAALSVLEVESPGSRGRESSLTLLGVDQRLPDARDFHPARGRYITAQDVRQKNHVCVLEPSLARELFGKRNPLGETLVVRLQDGLPLNLKVMGVMEQRGQERLSQDALGMSNERAQDLKALLRRVMGVVQFPGEWERDDRAVHVPASLLAADSGGAGWIYLRIHDLKQLQSCADTISQTMTARGVQVQLLFDASLPLVVGDQLDIYVDLNRAISSCCLVMGVLVVMILMLAGVLQRREEIGIRMVEGASRADIGIQFVVESLLTCLVGALLGIPASFVLAWVWMANELSQFASYSLPLGATLGTVTLIVAAGLLAGLVPAWHASRLDPVAILRHE